VVSCVTDRGWELSRLGSKQVAGYYPTPPSIVDTIAHVLTPDSVCVADPCAGEGDAVFRLRDALLRKPGIKTYPGSVLAVEMERSRHMFLNSNSLAKDSIAHGDFFHLQFTEEAANILYLNPPYDTDKDQCSYSLLRVFLYMSFPDML
jgi:type I restriction-modification system DNA methylase subunit